MVIHRLDQAFVIRTFVRLFINSNLVSNNFLISYLYTNNMYLNSKKSCIKSEF
jgi:hypothetical protein